MFICEIEGGACDHVTSWFVHLKQLAILISYHVTVSFKHIENKAVDLKQTPKLKKQMQFIQIPLMDSHD